MITAEQLKEDRERTEQLNSYLNIDAKKIQLEEEQLRTQAPEFWDDQKRAEAQMKLVKGLEKWINGYAEVKSLSDLIYASHGDSVAVTLVDGKITHSRTSSKATTP